MLSFPIIILCSVVIIFITDTDEYLFKIMMVINEDWAKGTNNPGREQEGSSENESSELRTKLEGVEKEVKDLKTKLEQALCKLQAMEEQSAKPQDRGNENIDREGRGLSREKGQMGLISS